MGCEAAVLRHSLQKIASLPDDTLVYPGHNYTRENYEFALTIEPEKQALKDEIEKLKELQKEMRPTVPSTLKKEKELNIFLRCEAPEIKKILNMQDAPAGDVFTELRAKKNIFG